MKWFVFLLIICSGNLFAQTTKVCAKDIKTLECGTFKDSELEFCLWKDQSKLSKECKEFLQKDVDAFTPVIKSCRDQMPLHCKDYKKHEMKKCLKINKSKFLGDCGTNLKKYFK